MEHLSSDMEQLNQDQQVQWRRDKVQELCSKGYSQREISQILRIGLDTVNRVALEEASKYLESLTFTKKDFYLIC